MLTVEQIKTLINGLKQPLLSMAGRLIEAEETARQALKMADQAQSKALKKMNKVNPVCSGSFSLDRDMRHPIGVNSSAVGTSVIAIGVASHAEGGYTTALEEFSHAEGQYSRALGIASHTEGYDTEANGPYAHAEGNGTKAQGYGSHAEGGYTEARGEYSHVEGWFTTAEGQYCHAEGCFNIPMEGLLHIVGNGSDNRRSNAHTLDREGNAWFQGDVLVGSTSGTNRDAGSVRLAKITEVIPVPAKAEVGQALQVSAVDESGAPTAWEPIYLNKGSLPNAGGVAGSEVALALENNVEYHCSDPVTALTIQGFTPAEDGKVSMWAIQFTAGSSITVIIPNTVRWAIAEPVFDADVTYWLSFVPLVNGEILGVWVSNE